MTRSQLLALAIGAVVVVLAGVAIGLWLSRQAPSPSPSPSPSSAVACQAAVTPDTIRIDPDTGLSDDVVFLVGTGFPAETVVTVDFMTGQGLDTTSSPDGDVSVEITPEPGVTHPDSPDLAAGPVTWIVASGCRAEVVVTIVFSREPSPSPTFGIPIGLSAGDYAEIIADGVRVRVSPSPTSTVVCALFSADVVRILAPAQMAEGYAWYRIETVIIQSVEPLEGYIAAGADGVPFLRQTGEPPPPTPTPAPSASP